jgi:Flp pilus assembly secretin CpaC
MEVVRTRLLVVAWLAALFIASVAFGGSLPAKAPYTNPVTIRSSDPGTTLDQAIRAAARAAGVQVLTKELPDIRVSVDFKAVPFRDLLDLLLRIYAPDHDYALLPEGVVLVAPKAALKGLLPAKEEEKKPAPAQAGEAKASVVVPVTPLGEEVAEAAKALGVTAFYVKGAGALVLTGEASKVAAAASLVRELAAQAKANVPPLPPPPEAPKTERVVARVPEGLSAEDIASLAQTLGLKTTALKEANLVVLEGTKEALDDFQRVLSEAKTSARKTQDKAIASFEIPEGLAPQEVVGALKALYPQASVTVAGRLVAVQATKEELVEIQGLLERIKGSVRPPAGSALLAFALPEGIEGGKAVEAIKALYPEAKAAALGRILLLEAPADQAPRFKEAVEALIAQLATTLQPQVERAKRSPAATYPVKGYPIYGDPQDIARAMTGLFPAGYLEEIGATVQVLPQQKAVVVAAPYEVHRKVVDLLRTIDPPKEEAKAEAERSVRVVLTNLTADKAINYLKAAEIRVTTVAEPSGAALWLKGTAGEVDRALLLLQTADANPPQVRIAVRVVQLERSALDQLSGDVTAALQGLNLALSGASGLGASYTLPASLARSLTLNLSALESKGLAKTLLNTEVTALDGQEVTLNSGGTLYVLGQTGGGQGGQGDQGAGASLTQIDYGLILKVTPRVVPEPLGATMKVTIELGNLPVGGPITGSIDISKRKLEALLRLKSEETGLIGGLLQEEERNQEGGVPILKDLPLIGALFRSNETRRTERVLLVMLTPTVYDYAAGIKSLPPMGKGDQNAPLEDPRTPPEPPKEEMDRGGAGRDGAAQGGTVQEGASTPVRPALPAFPPPSPDYSGQAYLTPKGAALYVLGAKTSPLARPVQVYLVREDKEGRPVSALEVPFRANRETFGGGAMAVLVLEAEPDSLAVANRVVLLLEDELGKAWSLSLPLSKTR